MLGAGGAARGRWCSSGPVWKGSVCGSCWARRLLPSCNLLRLKEPCGPSTHLHTPTSHFRALISVLGRTSQGSPPTRRRSTRSCPSSSTWAETLGRDSPSGEPGACGGQDACTGGRLRLEVKTRLRQPGSQCGAETWQEQTAGPVPMGPQQPDCPLGPHRGQGQWVTGPALLRPLVFHLLGFPLSHIPAPASCSQCLFQPGHGTGGAHDPTPSIPQAFSPPHRWVVWASRFPGGV